jgi:trans-aconitate methyltransferase
MTTNLHDKNVAVNFYEERYVDGYMEEWDELKKGMIREIIENFQFPQKGKALDFGCGNGVFTNLLKELLPDWELYGVEISKTALLNAQKNNVNCSFFSFEEADMHKGEFDFIFSHHVLEHVQNIDQTFSDINDYLKQNSSQLHILPCGNEGSYEYKICTLKKNGIEKDKHNRFFFEEPGHLRRLNTNEFSLQENKFGFELKKEFYSNQLDGAINWITKSSPRFVKKLTDTKDALDLNAVKDLNNFRKRLLPLTYLQFPYTKYCQFKFKWKKGIIDWIILIILFLPAQISKIIAKKIDKKAIEEWINNKSNKAGSEMFLFYQR